MNNKKSSFYTSTRFVIIMLIVFFPFGLILMYANKKFTPLVRKTITGIFGVMSLIVIGNNIINPTPAESIPANTPVAEAPVSTPEPISETPVSTQEPISKPISETPTPKPEPEPVANKYKYEILQVDDTGFANVIRKNLFVKAIDAEGIKTAEFQALCQAIIKEYTATTKVNAISLYFVDDANGINNGYTLGMCTYYPNGNIGDAENVTSGDYSKFKYTYTFEERDESRKPTDREMEIYNYFSELFDGADYSYIQEPTLQELANHYSTDINDIESNYEGYLLVYYQNTHDEICTQKTAEKFNITTDEVWEIWSKVNYYVN